MEKLKAKHDHKLTDILKVAIFGLMLILPGIMFLPSCMYYAVNKYATPLTSQAENTTQIELKQSVINGKPTDLNNISDPNENSMHIENGYLRYLADNSESVEIDYEINLNMQINDKIYLSLNAYATNYIDLEFELDGPVVHTFTINDEPKKYSYIYTNTDNEMDVQYCFVYGAFEDTNEIIYLKDFQIFNLTQIYGNGNEPTIEEFNNTWKEDYYEYNTKYYADIPNGTYTTFTDIPRELDLQWQSLWNKPILKWTNTSILKQGLDNFTYVFGITQTSYITNLITYELIMVAIYIVIDIVLTLFKWLTHLIGEK